MQIKSSHKTTLRLVLGGKEKSGSAYTPFGPLKVGLITTQSTNKGQVLTELLNSLERKIAELNTKSLEVLGILENDTPLPVERGHSIKTTDTIKDV